MCLLVMIVLMYGNVVVWTMEIEGVLFKVVVYFVCCLEIQVVECVLNEYFEVLCDMCGFDGVCVFFQCSVMTLFMHCEVLVRLLGTMCHVLLYLLCLGMGVAVDQVFAGGGDLLFQVGVARFVGTIVFWYEDIVVWLFEIVGLFYEVLEHFVCAMVLQWVGMDLVVFFEFDIFIEVGLRCFLCEQFMSVIIDWWVEVV